MKTNIKILIYYLLYICSGMVLDSAFADLTMLAEEMVRH